MRKEYTIAKVNLNTTSKESIWNKIEPVKIECYPWNQNNYMPKTQVKVFYTDYEFHVQFISWENEIKSEYFAMNDPVYKDSCVEFFFNPVPEANDRYLNFEVNPVGTMLLGYGKDRCDRIFPASEDDFMFFHIKTSVQPEGVRNFTSGVWRVEYRIPFGFIKRLYGNHDFCSGKKMNANFYKCGDCTKYPHYGCWNSIQNSTPDFHRPESFGELRLE